MGWTLQAAGTAEDGDAEQDLKDRLAELLSGPRYGCSESQLATEAHNGPVHEQAAAAEESADEE